MVFHMIIYKPFQIEVVSFSDRLENISSAILKVYLKWNFPATGRIEAHIGYLATKTSYPTPRF